MKILVIILSVILVLGLLLAGVGLIITGGNLNTIFQNDVRTEKNVDETHSVSSLKVTSLADTIELYQSEDEFLHIDYWDSELSPFSYSCENGVAELKQVSTFKSWFNFGSFENKIIKIYVPSSLTNELSINLASGDVTNSGCVINVQTLKLNLSSGNVTLSGITASTLDIDNSSGDVALTTLSAETATVKLSSGHITLTNAVITNADFLSSSGGITLIDCNVTTLTAGLSSGDITAVNLISDSIKTNISSGSTDIQIAGNAVDYSIKVDISSGSVSLSGTGIALQTESDMSWGTGAKSVDCTSSSGNVRITFA